jgi:hypothetical protein
MPLIDSFQTKTEASGKARKHADMVGLYLYFSTTSLGTWQFDYRFEGKWTDSDLRDIIP